MFYIVKTILRTLFYPLSIVFVFIFGFVLGLNFHSLPVLAQVYEVDQVDSYLNDQIESLALTGEYKQIIQKDFFVNTYESLCKGYQVVYVNPDGSESAFGYGPLAEQYTYEKTSIPVPVSATSSSIR